MDRQGSEAEVYLSNGERRELVMLKAKLKLGTLVLRLERYSAPSHQASDHRSSNGNMTAKMDRHIQTALVVLLVLGSACAPAQSPDSVVANERACAGEVPVTFAADTVLDAGKGKGKYQIRPTTSGAPRYPREMLGVREGRVLVSFVIDTLGAVVPGSTRVNQESDYAFGQAVCTWLQRVRFEPLRV